MDNAFRLAESQHRYQLRKGTKIPYISHLMAVASLVLEYGGTQEQAKAALLHDVLEDTGLTYDELRDVVGTAVADIVQNCTHIEGESEKTPEAWKLRKQRYLDRILSQGRREDGTIADFVLVTLADKTHNIETTQRDLMFIDDREEFFSRFNVGEDLQRWWYTELATTYMNVLQFASSGLDGLFDRFRLAVGNVFPGNWVFLENAYDEY